jgi:signal transduction histidine kinase
LKATQGFHNNFTTLIIVISVILFLISVSLLFFYVNVSINDFKLLLTTDPNSEFPNANLAIYFILFTASMIGIYFGSDYLIKRQLNFEVSQFDRAITAILNLQHVSEVDEIDFKLLRSSYRNLKIATVKINKTVDSLNSYSSDIAHELKTPLTILRGELEMAVVSAREREDYLLVIGSALDEVHRLSKILNTMHDLTLADSGQNTLNLGKSVDVNHLLNELAEDAEILASEKKIRIKKIINEECIVKSLDADRIHQVFLNIVDNAIKYSNPNGEIEIELINHDETFSVTVRDKGIGIPEEHINRIFDRFFRSDNAKQSGARGTGLGLAIVKWIVEAHNGTISVASKVDEGTSITINLPK